MSGGTGNAAEVHGYLIFCGVEKCTFHGQEATGGALGTHLFCSHVIVPRGSNTQREPQGRARRSH